MCYSIVYSLLTININVGTTIYVSIVGTTMCVSITHAKLHVLRWPSTQLNPVACMHNTSKTVLTMILKSELEHYLIGNRMSKS